MGCGTAISLPFSAVAAMFVGVERYGIPAVVLGSGRIVQVVVTGLTAYATHDLTKIAVAYVGCLLTMQAAFLFILRKQYPDILGEREAVPRAAIQELLKYCFSLCVWNFSMFLVYGLDAGIVAEIDFKSLAPYALCLNLIALLTGFMGSAFNVLISRAAALEGAGEHEEVGRLLVSSTKISTSLLLAIGCLCPLLARPLFAAWVGPALRDAAMPFLWVLIVANGVRLLLTPYASLLMGAGDHKWASLTALAEGFSNLVASLLLGRIYGAIGVAYGTLVGALVSLTLAIFYTFPRATRIKCPRRAFLLDGFLTPAGKFIPLAIGMIVFERSPGPMTLTAVVIGLLATGFLLARVPSLRLGATHV
jgi:O-antigen/teichoic acid export membrane protein